MGRAWRQKKRELDEAHELTRKSLEAWQQENATYQDLEKQTPEQAKQIGAQINLLRVDHETAKRESDKLWRELTDIADFNRARSAARQQLWQMRWERLRVAMLCGWRRSGHSSTVDARFSLVGDDDDDDEGNRGCEMSENRQNE